MLSEPRTANPSSPLDPDEHKLVADARAAASRMILRIKGQVPTGRWPSLDDDITALADACDELQRRLREQDMWHPPSNRLTNQPPSEDRHASSCPMSGGTISESNASDWCNCRLSHSDQDIPSVREATGSILPEHVRRWLGQTLPDANFPGRAEIIAWRSRILVAAKQPKTSGTEISSPPINGQRANAEGTGAASRSPQPTSCRPEGSKETGALPSSDVSHAPWAEARAFDEALDKALDEIADMRRVADTVGERDIIDGAYNRVNAIHGVWARGKRPVPCRRPDANGSACECCQVAWHREELRPGKEKDGIMECSFCTGRSTHLVPMCAEHKHEFSRSVELPLADVSFAPGDRVQTCSIEPPPTHGRVVTIIPGPLAEVRWDDGGISRVDVSILRTSPEEKE